MDFNSRLTEGQPIFDNQTAPSGERPPDGAATPPCTVCGSTEPPDSQGQCPVKTCRAARRGNKLAAVHDGRAKMTPADYSARDALMARLFAERGGRGGLDIVTQLRIEDFATAQIQLGKVTKRLEASGAVSEAGNKRTSLVDTYNTFSARVERLAAELPPVRTLTAARPDLSTCTPAELVARLEAAVVPRPSRRAG